MCAWLLSLGAKVRGYALPPETQGVAEGFSPLFDELDLAKAMEHQTADIRNRDTLSLALSEFKPNIVIHMAAQPLVRLSYKDPVETYETNVMGTVNLLDACRELSELRSVVIVTSDKCYQNLEQVWPYRETDRLGGHDPYSNSKGCAEMITSAYRNSFFNPARHSDHGVAICSARAGNVIGGGDWSEDRLIPDAMRAFLTGDKLSIRNPCAVRPWQHVLEPVSGYLRLAEYCYEAPENASKPWNFGPSESMNLSVGDVIEKLSVHLGEGFQWCTDDPGNHPHEARLLKLDCNLARTQLGWLPQLEADETIQFTTRWYTAKNSDERVSITAEQIQRFSKV